MKQMMTYHNIRNMIYQLPLSGEYCDKFNYSNQYVDYYIEHDCKVEFDYSTDKDVTDHVSCLLVDNTNGYEIFITVVMYRNGTRTELGVVLKSDNKNDVMTCGKPIEGYAVFRTRMHMIHHKATKRLFKRIYERMIIPMMNREVYEHLMSEEKEC